MTDDRDARPLAPDAPAVGEDATVSADAAVAADASGTTVASRGGVAHPTEARWSLAGAGVGAFLVLVAAIGLMTVDGNALKAMVAAWLWLLPVSGIGAGIGWLLGRAFRRGAASHRATAPPAGERSDG